MIDINILHIELDSRLQSKHEEEYTTNLLQLNPLKWNGHKVKLGNTKRSYGDKMFS